MPKQNFSSKFQLWAKRIAAPPRAIHIKKFRTCGHVQNLSKGQKTSLVLPGNAFDTVVLIRDQTRSVAKQVSVAVGWVKIKISLMAQLKGLTAKFKLM